MRLQNDSFGGTARMTLIMVVTHLHDIVQKLEIVDTDQGLDFSSNSLYFGSATVIQRNLSQRSEA
ncbi:hypothetical protein HanRHA438_Chr14g0663631 [Helianthus annuus]|nr:hypothetical protein HanRHA438_Chr14g0663631 [Helianthus annuus]